MDPHRFNARSSLVAGSLAVLLVGLAASAAPATGPITEFPGYIGPSAQPQGAAIARDGNLWLTDAGVPASAGLWRLSFPSGGVPAHILLPASALDGQPTYLAAGPRPYGTVIDGDLWYVGYNTADPIVGQTQTNGATAVCHPTGTHQFVDIALGPKQTPPGNYANETLWFTDYGGSAIGRVRGPLPGGCGSIGFIPLTGTGNQQPWGIAAGRDGAMWFTIPSGGPNGDGAIGRLDPATLAVTEYSTGIQTGANPWNITAGPDGNMWFSEDFHGSVTGNSVGKVDLNTCSPITACVITEYNISTAVTTGRLTSIVSGQDGYLYVTGFNHSGVIGFDPTSCGAGTCGFTEYPQNNPNANTQQITPGPDGNLWFAEYSLAEFGRLWDSQLNYAYVLVRDFHYTPLKPFFCSAAMCGGAAVTPVLKLAHQGMTVQWSFYGPNLHNVADTSGMGLFNSGVHSFVSYYSFLFAGAGKYPYQDSLYPTLMKGQVWVPINVILQLPATNQALVTWSSAPATGAYVYDVQVCRPGGPCGPNGTGWVDWKPDQTGTSALFQSTDPLWTVQGTYWFRARTRNSSAGGSACAPQAGACSGWSEGQSVSLTP